MFLKKKVLAEVARHPKGWGAEYWVENNPEYCGKILAISAGKKCSLHFHMNKLETMMVIKGNVVIRFIEPDTGQDYAVQLDTGDSIQIPRGQVHQIISPTQDSEVIEFSTYHDDKDSYRVQKGD